MNSNIMKSPKAITEELGDRLKQARLNIDITQAELAEKTGLKRRTVLNAEQGNVSLINLVIILTALNLTEHLDMFLPVQEISPLQLAKLKGKKRKRASGNSKSKNKKEDKSLW